MKKILSALVFVMCLGVFNFCSALSIDEAIFVCHSQRSTYFYNGKLDKFDLYIDRSDNTCVWEYPSGEQSIIVTVFYFDPKSQTIITDVNDPERPVVFDFIKDKNGTWGFCIENLKFRDRLTNRKGIPKAGRFTSPSYYPVDSDYNNDNNHWPLRVLQKIGEYIDLDSFPSVN